MDLEIKTALTKLQSLKDEGLIEESIYLERQMQIVKIYTSISLEDGNTMSLQDIVDFIDQSNARFVDCVEVEAPRASPVTVTERSSSTEVMSTGSFDDMGLSNELLRGVYCYGFEWPSVIQQKTIVPISQGRDIAAQALSGTGKTAAYVIGSLARVNLKTLSPQFIIVAPSRELAQQISLVVIELSTFMEGFSMGLAIGGTSLKECSKKFRKGVHGVVGTPGRILQLLKSGILSTTHVITIIFDEGDELLSHPSVDNIHEIFLSLPRDIQACVFSTTLPDESIYYIEKFARDPVNIFIDDQHILSDNKSVNHFMVDVQEEQYKVDTLLDIVNDLQSCSIIIFCNTNRKVDWLCEKMKENGVVVSASHGSLYQNDRETALREFKQGSARILITTDSLGRGIDIISLQVVVINFDIPRSDEKYVHRAGRTGRFSRRGTIISFLVDNQNDYMTPSLKNILSRSKNYLTTSQI